MSELKYKIKNNSGLTIKVIKLYNTVCFNANNEELEEILLDCNKNNEWLEIEYNNNWFYLNVYVNSITKIITLEMSE